MTFGGRIKDLRKTAGLTQHQLAKLAGIAQSTLGDIESGATKHSYGPTAVRLAQALNVSPDWLSSGRGPMVRASGADPDESEALHIYRALPKAMREAWMASGRALLAQVGPSIANPYPAKAKG